MTIEAVAIIGAGLAGLAAGVYAQLNGYQAHIFEHHSQAGGVAATWRRGEYTIEGGIHFLMGHRAGNPMHDLYRALGTADPADVADMGEYGRYVDEGSGRSITIGSDLDQLAADLKAISPADSGAIDDLAACADALRGPEIWGLGMGDPPELTGLLGQLRQLWAMRGLLRFYAGKYGQTVGQFTKSFHDPFLRRLVDNLFLPDVPVWFLGSVLGLLADRQMGLLLGGSQGFVQPIVRKFRALGGQISYNATVEEILVEEGRAAGVRLANGDVHRTDAVISAADGQSTIFKMLGGRYADEKIRARYRDWRLMKPFVTATFGVARTFAGEPHFTTIFLKEPFIAASEPVPGLGLRIFNYTDRFAPPGKSVIQAMFESPWDYWNDLQARDRPAYDAEKQRIAAEVLRRLESHYPGLASQVEVTDVSTPYTIWRYTLNWQGAYEGWLPTGPQMMTALPRTLPGLRNFVMAGQWVMPGGGVPICLISGRDAVRILCKWDGKAFAGSPPEAKAIRLSYASPAGADRRRSPGPKGLASCSPIRSRSGGLPTQPETRGQRARDQKPGDTTTRNPM